MKAPHWIAASSIVLSLGFLSSSLLADNAVSNQQIEVKKIALSNKDKAVALLNSFNTGDQTPISYINPNKYIQHNLDVFRFEEGLIVEHWDNLIEVQPANPSGRTQFDGVTEITDLDKTAANKQVVTDFIEKVLLDGQMDKLTTYINPNKYLQHNPAVADGLDGFGEAMKYFAENGLVMEYRKLHKVLGQGNFVLAMSEGKFGKGEHTAFYDLFRLEDGQIVEHWDVIQAIPEKAKWKNDNGKF